MAYLSRCEVTGADRGSRRRRASPSANCHQPGAARRFAATGAACQGRWMRSGRDRLRQAGPGPPAGPPINLSGRRRGFGEHVTVRADRADRKGHHRPPAAPG